MKTRWMMVWKKVKDNNEDELYVDSKPTFKDDNVKNNNEDKINVCLKNMDK